MRGRSMVTRRLPGKVSTSITRPLTVVGPMRSFSTGAATAAVRHWAAANPATIIPAIAKTAKRAPPPWPPGFLTTNAAAKTAATPTGPSHGGGSKERPK